MEHLNQLGIVAETCRGIGVADCPGFYSSVTQQAERCVAGVGPVWQNILAVAFVITWLGGTAVLFFHYRAKQRAYLHHFPPSKAFRSTCIGVVVRGV